MHLWFVLPKQILPAPRGLMQSSQHQQWSRNKWSESNTLRQLLQRMYQMLDQPQSTPCLPDALTSTPCTFSFMWSSRVVFPSFRFFQQYPSFLYFTFFLLYRIIEPFWGLKAEEADSIILSRRSYKLGHTGISIRIEGAVEVIQYNPLQCTGNCSSLPDRWPSSLYVETFNTWRLMTDMRQALYGAWQHCNEILFQV